MSEQKRTLNWTPESFEAEEGKPAKYYGHFTIQLPKGRERTSWIAQVGLLGDTSSGGEEMLLKLWDLGKHLIVGVDITRASDGGKITSLDDVEYEEGLAWIPLQFGRKILSGFGPGNG